MDCATDTCQRLVFQFGCMACLGGWNKVVPHILSTWLTSQGVTAAS
jgi:hypothetical protein